ncbi:Hypothetical protein GLP15_4812 [Giardia lamblia P15]|uniref:Uncharacterized protein n=1 Tax=Giardia intestinalis (strain P15) TaxID=658858 RepID=E1F1F6_GIAIA|nr:Hypothetical protein GLP15_4812 [Giardia lamblia P15]
MRDLVSDSVSSSGYCELPSSFGQETEDLGPSKLSGSVHRNAKQMRPQRKVTFDGHLKSIAKTHVSELCIAESVEHVPPEIELPNTATHAQIASETTEDVEPLERFQILVRLGFDAYFRENGSTLAPRHFWIHEDMDEGHILLWADCERTSLKGAIPVRDILAISCTEEAELALKAGESVAHIVFTAPRERDFWRSKLELLRSLS